jgi:hypothetical protein
MNVCSGFKTCLFRTSLLIILVGNFVALNLQISLGALVGTYVYASKQRFINIQAPTIVFALFLAVFFLVYLTLAFITLARQLLKVSLISYSTFTVLLLLLIFSSSSS